MEVLDECLDWQKALGQQPVLRHLAFTWEPCEFEEKFLDPRWCTDGSCGQTHRTGLPFWVWNKKSNLKCLWPTLCPNSDNYCVTVSAAAGFGNINLGYTLNKGCAQICPRENINVNLGVASVNSYCCMHSFCNISTAGFGLRASIPLLGLGLLFSLLALLHRDP
ncbi:lymphocyte antigen 6E [Sigmodon hispidus]